MLTSLLLATALLAAPQDLSERDRRVGQVIHDAIVLRAGGGAPSDEALWRFKLGRGNTDADSYVYVSEAGANDGQGRRSRWDVKVSFLPPDWAPDADEEARWAARFQEVDAVTGAHLYFHEVDDRSRSSYVTARVKRGSTRVLLRDARSGGLDYGAHKPLAMERLKFFIKRAEEEQLFDDVAPRIVLTIDGNEVGDGDVVSVDHPLSEPLDFALRGWTEGVELPPADGLELVLELDPLGARAAELRQQGRGAGARLARRLVRGDEEVQAGVRFRAFEPKPGDPIGQVAILTVSMPGAAEGVLPIRVTLHRTTWIPVLRSFEVRQPMKERQGIVTDQLAELEGELGPLSPLDEMVARGWVLNDYRVHAASLAAAWADLARAARIRPSLERDAPGGVTHPDGQPFGDEDPVLLGWRLDPETLIDFAVAEVAPGEAATLGAWTANVRHQIVYDLWIARDPTPPGVKFGDDLFEDDLLEAEEPAAEAVADETPRRPLAELGPDGLPADPQLRDQVRRREQILLEDFELTRVLVQREGIAVPENRKLEDLSEAELDAYARRLHAGLRRPAGLDEEVLPLMHPPQRLLRLTEYPFILPVAGPAVLELPVSRNEGVYELRLRMAFRHVDQNDVKRVEAAIRVNLVKQGFSVLQLNYQSRRVR